MKCLKKFLALGMCVGVMSTSSCSASLPDEVKEFYLSTGIDEVILETQEGLSAVCYFLNGGYGSMLIGQTALENYLSQVYGQMGNNLASLSSHLAAHLEGIREKASDSFKFNVGSRSLIKSISVLNKSWREPFATHLESIRETASERPLAVQSVRAHSSVLSELDTPECIYTTSLGNLLPMFRKRLLKKKNHCKKPPFHIFVEDNYDDMSIADGNMDTIDHLSESSCESSYDLL